MAPTEKYQNIVKTHPIWLKRIWCKNLCIKVPFKFPIVDHLKQFKDTILRFKNYWNYGDNENIIADTFVINTVTLHIIIAIYLESDVSFTSLL